MVYYCMVYYGLLWTMVIFLTPLSDPFFFLPPKKPSTGRGPRLDELDLAASETFEAIDEMLHLRCWVRDIFLCGKTH